MKKTLRLYQKFGKFEEIAQLLLSNKDISVTIKWNEIKGSRVEAVISNGDTVRVVPVVNNEFTIDKDLLKVGAIRVIINVFVGNVVVQKYVCENLFIVEDNSKFETIPEMEVLKAEIKGYREEQEKLTEKVNYLTKLVEGLYGFTIEGGK